MLHVQATGVPAYPPVMAEPRVAARCTDCTVRPHTVCGAIAREQLGRVAAIAVTLHVPAGRSFIVEGDPADYFFNVTAGTAKLFKLLPDGRRQITGFAVLGDFLGLAVSDTYAFGAEAVDDVRICRFSRDKLHALLAEFPDMHARLVAIASDELVAAQEQMLLLGRKTARERLASFLLARVLVTAGRPAIADDHVVLPMVRSDIADYLGMTVETVCRTLTRLKGEGMISIAGPSHVSIRDAVALRALATGL